MAEEESVKFSFLDYTSITLRAVPFPKVTWLFVIVASFAVFKLQENYNWGVLGKTFHPFVVAFTFYCISNGLLYSETGEKRLKDVLRRPALSVINLSAYCFFLLVLYINNPFICIQLASLLPSMKFLVLILHKDVHFLKKFYPRLNGLTKVVDVYALAKISAAFHVANFCFLQYLAFVVEPNDWPKYLIAWFPIYYFLTHFFQCFYVAYYVMKRIELRP